MITKAEADGRTIRAMFAHAGIRHDCLVMCVREALASYRPPVEAAGASQHGERGTAGAVDTIVHPMNAPHTAPPKAGGRKTAKRRTRSRD